MHDAFNCADVFFIRGAKGQTCAGVVSCLKQEARKGGGQTTSHPPAQDARTMSKESDHLCQKKVLPSVDLMILEATKLQNLSALKVTAPLGWKVIYFSSYKTELVSEMQLLSRAPLQKARIQATAATKRIRSILWLVKMDNNQNPACHMQTFMGCWSKRLERGVFFL